MEGLFKDSDGKIYGPEDVYHNLKMVGADDCEALFIHSDIMFGTPIEGFNRRKYLCILYDVIDSLGVKNVIVPTFTYSFCNHEDYDVAGSKTTMGAFNEFVRKQEGRYRTLDPLLSLSVPDHLKDFFMQYDGRHSLGEKGGLDAIHHMDGAKFLFLGADMGSCFTYVHYVEKMLNVPYRFDMGFHGTVIDRGGHALERAQFIHTQCYGVRVPGSYGYFEDELVDAGFVKKARLGNKYVSCISEKDAYRQISDRIRKDVNYFLECPFTEADLVHRYVYDLNKGRITHC